MSREGRLESIGHRVARSILRERPIVGFALLVYDADGHYAFVTNDGHAKASEALMRAVIARGDDQPSEGP